MLAFTSTVCTTSNHELLVLCRTRKNRLYDTAEYSDLTISCGNKNYLVHKAIVCPRSDFFASACGEIAPEVSVIRFNEKLYKMGLLITDIKN